MIPQNLIDDAAHAMYLRDNPDAKFPDAPPWAQIRYEQRAQAAIEAVAAGVWENGYETATLAAVKEFATELANNGDRGWIAPIGDELLFILENGYRE